MRDSHSNELTRSSQQEVLLHHESVALAMPEDGIQEDLESDSELEDYFSTPSTSVVHRLTKSIKDKLAYLVCIVLWLLATAIHFVCGFIAEKLYY